MGVEGLKIIFFLFSLGGASRTNEQRQRGGEKLLGFEGHQSHFINVKHSVLLSDIIKRLSSHSACLSISHCLSPSFLPSKIKETLSSAVACSFVLVSLVVCFWFTFSLRCSFNMLWQSAALKIKQEINTSVISLVHFA